MSELSNYSGRPLMKNTAYNKLGMLVSVMIIMLVVVGFLSSALAYLPIGARNSMLFSSALQNVFCFIFPSWLVAWLFSHSPMVYLGACAPLSWRQCAGVVLLLVLLTPAMNLLVEWNDNASLPQSLQGLERAMRDMENRAADATDVLLGDTSVWGLISGILFVGVLTGLGEEFFFRAGLQKGMITTGTNPHLAIWLTAFIFSAIHMQFFGFFPRLLLGALFGYIYFTSGSIWLCALAHALNNSVVVVTQWLVANGYISQQIDNIGVAGPGAGWLALCSLLLTLAFVALLWKPLISRKQTPENG